MSAIETKLMLLADTVAEARPEAPARPETPIRAEAPVRPETGTGPQAPAVRMSSSRLVVAGPSGSTPRPAGVPEGSREFLLRLGEAFHAQGIPAHRLEAALARCADGLGLPAQFFSTPTSFFAAFGEGAEQRTHLVRVYPGEPDLGRLADLREVAEAVGDGSCSPRDGLAWLDSLAAKGPRYGPMVTVLGFGLASACASRFFGGDLPHVALAAALGSLVGVLTLLAGRLAPLARVLEPFAAALAAGSAVLLAARLPGVSEGVLTLSALIVLLPGLTLTVALNELATGHWVSGNARLAGAATSFLSLLLGVAFGRHVALALGAAPPELAPALPELPAWTELAALFLAPVGFAVLFRARRVDVLPILVTSVLGFLGARLGARGLGPELGVFVGAALVAAVSHLGARLRGQSVSVTLVPGIMLLVPGSIGFRSLSSFLADDALSGLEGGFRMAFVAVSLVGGLLVGSALADSRRAL